MHTYMHTCIHNHASIRTHTYTGMCADFKRAIMSYRLLMCHPFPSVSLVWFSALHVNVYTTQNCLRVVSNQTVWSSASAKYALKKWVCAPVRGVLPMGNEAEIFIIAILWGNSHFWGREYLYNIHRHSFLVFPGGDSENRVGSVQIFRNMGEKLQICSKIMS